MSAEVERITEAKMYAQEIASTAQEERQVIRGLVEALLEAREAIRREDSSCFVGSGTAGTPEDCRCLGCDLRRALARIDSVLSEAQQEGRG